MHARGFYGWNVVAATSVMALFSFGLGFYGLSVYVATLQRQHGWSASTVSTPVTVYYLAGALLTASVGDLYERCGPRAVVASGSVAMAVGVAAIGSLVQPWQLYPAFLVMSLGWGAMSGAAINIVLAPWFQRRRGLAVSIGFTGATLGGVVVAPALIPLIDFVGFASALALAGLVQLVVMVALAAGVMRRGPEEFGHGPDGDPAPSPRLEPSPSGEGRRDALRTWRFWSVSAPFALGLAAQVGVLTHLVALVTPILGAGGAARAISATTAAALLGRLGTGFVVDHLNRRLVASATLVVQMVGLALLASESTAALVYAGLRPVRPGRRQPHDPPRPHPRRRVAAPAIQRAGRAGRGHQSVHLRLWTLARRRRARLERQLWLGDWSLYGPSSRRRRSRHARTLEGEAATGIAAHRGGLTGRLPYWILFPV